tara:strand:- start:412 stop:531 length:120 start_codon:yes stop_codon:yes gene_type:complete
MHTVFKSDSESANKIPQNIYQMIWDDALERHKKTLEDGD